MPPDPPRRRAVCASIAYWNPLSKILDLPLRPFHVFLLGDGNSLHACVSDLKHHYLQDTTTQWMYPLHRFICTSSSLFCFPVASRVQDLYGHFHVCNFDAKHLNAIYHLLALITGASDWSSVNYNDTHYLNIKVFLPPSPSSR